MSTKDPTSDDAKGAMNHTFFLIYQRLERLIVEQLKTLSLSQLLFLLKLDLENLLKRKELILYLEKPIYAIFLAAFFPYFIAKSVIKK